MEGTNILKFFKRSLKLLFNVRKGQLVVLFDINTTTFILELIKGIHSPTNIGI